MSLTPITQYASTANTFPRITGSAGASQAPKAPARTLASGQVQQANGVSHSVEAPAKSSLTVAYDRLSRQTDIGAAANDSSPVGSLLASYVQNSNGDASAQSLGTLFKSSA
jgi:hypothetical protein